MIDNPLVRRKWEKKEILSKMDGVEKDLII